MIAVDRVNGIDFASLSSPLFATASSTMSFSP
jgi:hypothetical protein